MYTMYALQNTVALSHAGITRISTLVRIPTLPTGDGDNKRRGETVSEDALSREEGLRQDGAETWSGVKGHARYNSVGV